MSTIRESKFCWSCRYCLDGLEEHCCPECGKSFDPDDRATYLSIQRRSSWVTTWLGLLVVAGTVAWWAIAAAGRWWLFVDLPLMIFVVGIVLGGLLTGCRARDIVMTFVTALTWRKVRDGYELATYLGVLTRAYYLAWAAGIIGALIGLIVSLASMVDPAAVGTAIAITLLATLYGAMLAELLFSPLQQRILTRSCADLRYLPKLAHTQPWTPLAGLVVLAVTIVYIVLLLF